MAIRSGSHRSKYSIECKESLLRGLLPATITDFFIEQALPSDIDADLPGRYASAFEQLALRLRDIFIQNIHADFSSSANSLACLSNALLASCTASPIASFVMLSFHSSMIVSQAIPLATCSRTSATNTRVPRKVGLP